MEHIWSVICEKSIIDQRTNNLSLIDVLEQVEFDVQFISKISEENTPQKPNAVPIVVHVVSMWERSGNEPEMTEGLVTFVSPDGQTLATLSQILDLSQHERLRSAAIAQGLPYVGDGKYFFHIQIQQDDNWQTVARIPLVLKHNPQIISSNP